jgi:hypothetical protein
MLNDKKVKISAKANWLKMEIPGKEIVSLYPQGMLIELKQLK